MCETLWQGNSFMPIFKLMAAVSLFSLVACAQEAPTSTVPPEAPDLAADTASLPGTDIFLARLSMDGDLPQVEAIRNITNASGYDNQPSFVSGAAAFYYVSEGESGKTDIWQYDIATDTKMVVFESPTVSEYSPQGAPMGYGISYIQENEAGDVTRVHAAPVSGGAGKAVISLAPLGYYAWLQGGMKLGVYMRSEPAALQVVDVATGEVEIIATNIGRSFKASPDGSGLYFTKDAKGEGFEVIYFDLTDNSLTAITTLPDGSQDYAISFTENGTRHGMFAGAGSELSFFDMTDEGAEWRVVADLAADGMTGITRIALSDDNGWISLVAEAH